MRRLLTVLLICATGLATAQVYRWVDEQGNVVFGDQPPENVQAEEIDVRPAQTVKTPPPPPPTPEQPAAPTPFKYQSLRVTSPPHDTSVRENAGNISITVAAEPPLLADRGHEFRFYMDGNLIGSGAGARLDLTNVDRGTHEVRAEIVDRQGRRLIASDTIVFTLHRHARAQ